MILFRYLCVGVLNTIVGFGVIFGLMLCGVNPEISNVFGIIFSYVVNKIFTFKSKNRSKTEFIKFILTMALAYILNFIALKIAINSGVNTYLLK